jgi:hypothetical protein
MTCSGVPVPDLFSPGAAPAPGTKHAVCPLPDWLIFTADYFFQPNMLECPGIEFTCAAGRAGGRGGRRACAWRPRRAGEPSRHAAAPQWRAHEPPPPPPGPTPARRSELRPKADLLRRAYAGAPDAQVVLSDHYYNYSNCVSAEVGPGKLRMPTDPSVGIPVRARSGAAGATAGRGRGEGAARRRGRAAAAPAASHGRAPPPPAAARSSCW